MAADGLDFERCYLAVESRDSRFDGWFITAVTSTGIYCRPSCPTPVRPKRANVRFLLTAAAAQRAGFRACKRCRPDASPGSPEWDVRADLVGRAMRLIADGVVDREGVAGLARKLAVSERHLNRLLTTDVGAGPIALARAQRAQTARLLIETTRLSFADVAFAAGFASIRQFNDTVRSVFALTPRELRRHGAGSNGSNGSDGSWPGELVVRLPFRPPFEAVGLLGFLTTRAVAGVEEVNDGAYRRTLRLPHGPATVTLAPARDHVQASFRLEAVSDLATAVQRCRRLLDLDADPLAVTDVLARDPILGPVVARAPGRRSPGAVDGGEQAVRAVVGQQVSVAGARTVAGRLVAAHGTPLATPDGGLTHLFPSPEALAAADPATLPMPAARKRGLQALCAAVANGDIDLDAGADRAHVERRLLELPGIGPWTVSYLALRALRDPDAFPATDLGVRHAAARLGLPRSPGDLTRYAERWRPWRAYATHHLWASLGPDGEDQ